MSEVMNSNFANREKSGSTISVTSVHLLPNYEKLRPHVRSCILKLLSQRLSSCTNHPSEEEDELIILIFLEYFKWIGYCHSADMLRKESKVLNSSECKEENLIDLVRGRLKLGSLRDGLPIIFSLISECKQ